MDEPHFCPALNIVPKDMALLSRYAVELHELRPVYKRASFFLRLRGAWVQAVTKEDVIRSNFLTVMGCHGDSCTTENSFHANENFRWGRN